MENRLSPGSTFWAAVNISPTFKILSQLKNLLLQIKVFHSLCNLAVWSFKCVGALKLFGQCLQGNLWVWKYIRSQQNCRISTQYNVHIMESDQSAAPLNSDLIVLQRFMWWVYLGEARLKLVPLLERNSDLFWAANPGWHIDNFETRIAQRSFGERKKLKTIIWNGNPTSPTSKHWIWTLYYMIVCHKLENTSFHLSGQIWCGAADNALK